MVLSALVTVDMHCHDDDQVKTSNMLNKFHFDHFGFGMVK